MPIEPADDLEYDPSSEELPNPESPQDPDSEPIASEEDMPNLLSPIMAEVIQYLKPCRDDLMGVRFTMSMALAGFRKEVIDKPWGWLEGPSGCMKTELVRTFYGYSNALFRDDFTAAALASAYSKEDDPDFDPSVLKEADGKCIICKDFAALGSRDSREIRQISGQLAGMHDGFYSKHGGSVGNRSYEFLMGLLIATTPLPDDVRRQLNRVGERFVSLRLHRGFFTRTERLRLISHAQRSAPFKEEWRKVLATTVQKAMSQAEPRIFRHYAAFHLTETQIERNSLLADLTSRLRTTPVDGASSLSETGLRLATQWQALGKVHALLEGRLYWNSVDDELLRRIAFDSIPRASLSVFLALYKNSKPLNLSEIQALTHLPSTILNPLLRQMMDTGLVELYGPTSYFTLTQETLEQTLESNFPTGSPTPLERKNP